MIETRVADKLIDKTPLGRLRAIYDWMTGAPDSPMDSEATTTVGAPDGQLPARIGHYTIVRKLGHGGMGVVYAARDERLQRTVALKTIAALAADDTARQRFWREARAAASVNHPNICQIYEIGEDNGELFIAMELLEGDVLVDRLRRDPIRVGEAMEIGLGILGALTALHARGIVHRDLKPSNVFLTRHGVKVLDFGLARPDTDVSNDASGDLTRPGVLIGTPRYMAPEQATGEPADARTDLFAAGAILFEMLAGRPAFDGRNVADVLHATRYEQPPALTGAPAVVAVDRVIRRALAKRRSDRYASASEMADELRSVGSLDGTDMPAQAHALKRLVVLPFRALRPDQETDFLAFSLPDAITTSLSSNGGLILRSSALAARFAGQTPDLKALAVEADVEGVVMGTLLRSGDQLRASVQLVETPSGTVLSSHTVQSSLGDLFQLQDDIVSRVVDALALPLATHTPPPTPDRPHDPRAYEHYLRGNELARRFDGLSQARELYRRCLDRDPTFAPAWAQLGRCHRVIGKFIESEPDSEVEAEAAFRRALALSPRLTIAHKFYANLEADTGRATQALRRLLGEAARHGNDPELFAGLVHACRYCGLFEQSIAAHSEARRLDPNVPTSVEQTVLMTGDIDRLIAIGPPPLGATGDEGIRVIGLGLAGRHAEASEMLTAMRHASRIPAFQSWTAYLGAWLNRSAAEMEASMKVFSSLKIEDDPEAIFQEGWLRCDIGEIAAALPYLQRAIAKGYFPVHTLKHHRAFDGLRSHAAYPPLVAAAEAGQQAALEVYRSAGGEGLLGS